MEKIKKLKMTKEEFVEKLKRSNRAPYLFIGSGFTRHYLDSPDWKGLLERFSPCHINKYYSQLGTSSLPMIASAIAEDVNNEFWSLPDDNSFKLEHQDKAVNKSSVLKIKMAKYFWDLSKKDFPEKYRDEISLLSNLNIDGIITTNWDDTAERIFPNFTPYIGQKELIFSPTYDMAEIYKIHGCMTKPESMVLTAEDYEDFVAKNSYLAAKLIILFIEHPVIFIGYSIADNNIQDILKSIINCLDKDDIVRLQNNLIFVEWTKDETVEMVIEKHDISLGNNIILPVTRIRCHEFMPIYECLSYYERSIPTNMLREYKKQFYNIVVSQKPEKTLYVLSDNQIDSNPNIQVVYGFGAINKYRSAVGYTGFKSEDLMKDVLESEEVYDPLHILTKTIPSLRKSNPKAFIPIYKYLSALDIHSDMDYKNNNIGVNIPLRKADEFASYTSFSDEDKQKTLSEAIDTYCHENDIWKAIALIPYLDISDDELILLKNFICQHFNDYIVKKKNPTFMRKLICFYDWRKYGWE